ncbi:hypothetical protein B7494_g3426 [Chlorociboria aeruginascens]|nr:hypothetical protein B7494_g3426 [Chlorociboria aeruginascens]
MFDPEIGRALQKETVTQDQELCPLNFYHDTRHFSYKFSSYPRLEIPHDLPRQLNANSSLATLHAYGVIHAITLNGTSDAGFHHSIRESIHRWQPVLDKLKDT